MIHNARVKKLEFDKVNGKKEAINYTKVFCAFCREKQFESKYFCILHEMSMYKYLGCSFLIGFNNSIFDALK